MTYKLIYFYKLSVLSSTIFSTQLLFFYYLFVVQPNESSSSNMLSYWYDINIPMSLVPYFHFFDILKKFFHFCSSLFKILGENSKC